MVDYGLRPGDQRESIRLLKLHGSVNWARPVDTPEEIEPWSVREFLRRLTISPLDANQTYRLEFSRHLTLFAPMERQMEKYPVIVPPTFNKASQNQVFLRVWQRAAEALRSAENIFVIGYSLPETDQFFKYLYGLGTVGDTILRRFWVFDPDNGVDERFRKLLGTMARPKYQFSKIDFAHAIRHLESKVHQL
jgi:hypothetical protein